ncbi:MAG: glycogen synthase GlgA [Deferribacteres bacterium]|nr:glycogen synthase GlgA [Deferribacteres bacterium]
MKVAFCTSECAPLVKVGGLADVSEALPKALKKEGIEVAIFLPLYRRVKESGFPIESTGLKVKVPIKGEVITAPIKKTVLHGVPVYLVEYDPYFDREHPYGTPYGDYPDNAYRFAFFSLAACEAMKALCYKPDVIHVNDWETALIPVYLKHYYFTDSFFLNTGTLLTIHNLAYQGVFPKDVLPEINLPWELFHIDGLEFYGNINYLKGGIIFSDLINTVSPTYAKEIQTEKYGYGLDGVLRKRRDSLYGVLNGIDYDEWDPEKDRRIYVNYGKGELDKKRQNKVKLMEELGLEVHDGPLAGTVSRLAEQKGLDLVHAVMGDLVGMGVSYVLLGSGEKRYQDMFLELNERYRGRVKAVIGFDDTLAARIYAGCDLFLMPSRYEPCGLGQMIALRYGTIPVVRKTGGLADTIKEFDPETCQGNGFVFEEFSPKDFLDAMSRAVKVYRDEEKWAVLVRKGMECDFSWEKSAREYIKLYDKIKSSKGGE